jgi:hypothetical protein
MGDPARMMVVMLGTGWPLAHGFFRRTGEPWLIGGARRTPLLERTALNPS